MELLLGAHTSAAGGAPNALYEGWNIGATTIQLFTSNQKQWHGRTIGEAEVTLWNQALQKTGMQKVMSHGSYLINLGSSDPEMLYKSRVAVREELQRCHRLNLAYLNIHPGVATHGTTEECLATIAESLLLLEDLVSKGPTRILLETTAGQGKSVGHRFEHLAFLMEKVHRTIPIGICIDTCHIFTAGYDIRTEEGWNSTLKEFDEVIGWNHLHAFHLNDSMKKLGSRVDRHAPLGKGEIGLLSFHFLMHNAKTRAIPKYLETPGGPPLWKEEIALLKSLAQKSL
jgi:deoxyribonuclease IV